MSGPRALLRWLLWLAVGALLMLRGGTAVTTRDGALLFGPAVFSGAAVVWLFVTIAVVRRRLAQMRK